MSAGLRVAVLGAGGHAKVVADAAMALARVTADVLRASIDEEAKPRESRA